MKSYNYLLGYVLTIVLFSSCLKDYEEPPLAEPIYTGEEANMTIAKLKSLHATTTATTLIDVDYIIKAVVTGNDISGNIYKQIYIQDETGGINMGVDQNSVYTYYRVGQEVYVNLKGLYIVVYGGQLQIGDDNANSNRIPWEVFKLHVIRNKWPQASNAVPTTISLASLNDDMVNTLVQVENVYFPGGGVQLYSDENTSGNRNLMDGDGNSVVLRSSNYATFAKDTLPKGGGTVVGLLTKFNSTWQFVIRTKDDCSFPGLPIPTPGGGTTTGKTYYSETFGTESIPSDARPKIADYLKFDNKTVTYSDPSGHVDVRTTSTITPHAWFPANSDNYLIIENIDTSEGTEDKIILNYELAANLSVGAEMNLNAMTVTVDGVSMSVPSQVVSNANGDSNKFYAVSLQNIPAKKGLTIQFFTSSALNTGGLRLDNISITSQTEEVIIIKPKS